MVLSVKQDEAPDPHHMRFFGSGEPLVKARLRRGVVAEQALPRWRAPRPSPRRPCRSAARSPRGRSGLRRRGSWAVGLRNAIGRLRNRSVIFGRRSIILGRRVVILGRRSVIFGRRSIIFGRRSVILGRRSVIFRRRLVILGRRSVIFGRRLVILGRRSLIFGRRSVILGRQLVISEVQFLIESLQQVPFFDAARLREVGFDRKQHNLGLAWRSRITLPACAGLRQARSRIFTTGPTGG